MNPLVSVVIPVYNGEKYIERTLLSVLSQTYDRLEVIVIDDASTDSTPDILSRFRGDVLYHRNERRRERCFSRNLGASLARGEFIFFLDADDLWDRRYLERVVPFLEKSDMVYTFPRRFIDEKGKLLRRSSKKLPPDTGELIFSGMVGYPSATAVSKEKFPGYREEFLMREDWELFIRAFLEGKRILVLDEDLVMIREHGGRTSRSEEFFLATRRVYKTYREKIPPRYLPYFVFHFAETAMRYWHAQEGWKELLPLLLRNPSLLLNARRVLSLLKRGYRFKLFR